MENFPWRFFFGRDVTFTGGCFQSLIIIFQSNIIIINYCQPIVCTCMSLNVCTCMYNNNAISVLTSPDQGPAPPFHCVCLHRVVVPRMPELPRTPPQVQDDHCPVRSTPCNNYILTYSKIVGPSQQLKSDCIPNPTKHNLSCGNNSSHLSTLQTTHHIFIQHKSSRPTPKVICWKVYSMWTGVSQMMSVWDFQAIDS